MTPTLKQIKLENQIKKECREQAAFNRLMSAVKSANDNVRADIKTQRKSIPQLRSEIKHIQHHCRSNPTYRKYNWPGISTAYRATCSICGNHIGWISKKTFDGISRMKRQHSH